MKTRYGFLLARARLQPEQYSRLPRNPVPDSFRSAAVQSHSPSKSRWGYWLSGSDKACPKAARNRDPDWTSVRVDFPSSFQATTSACTTPMMTRSAPIVTKNTVARPAYRPRPMSTPAKV